MKGEGDDKVMPVSRPGPLFNVSLCQIGSFVICGHYNAKMEITFIKQYIGKHSVDYTGTIDATGRSSVIVNGEWKLQSLSGNFQLRIPR